MAISMKKFKKLRKKAMNHPSCPLHSSKGSKWFRVDENGNYQCVWCLIDKVSINER